MGQVARAGREQMGASAVCAAPGGLEEGLLLCRQLTICDAGPSGGVRASAASRCSHIRRARGRLPAPVPRSAAPAETHGEGHGSRSTRPASRLRTFPTRGRLACPRPSEREAGSSEGRGAAGGAPRSPRRRDGSVAAWPRGVVRRHAGFTRQVARGPGAQTQDADSLSASCFF